MSFLASPYIRRPGDGGLDFVQVLLTELTLSRAGDGSRLTVAFDRDTPCIGERAAKSDVRLRIPDFTRRSEALQRDLDRFLLDGEGEELRVGEPDFPFRYVSGGALPVLHVGPPGGRPSTAPGGYYCLFYRDVFPIGWNIACGGTNTWEELLEPTVAIERELCEELLIADLEAERCCVFGNLSERAAAEAVSAYSVWAKVVPSLGGRLEAVTVPIRWGHGPDTLRIEWNNGDGWRTSEVAACFVNVNAVDFGIEIDRVAHIAVGEGFAVCDGELSSGRPLNQVVGLFDAAKMNEAVVRGDARFFPDRVFWSGRERAAADLEGAVDDYLEQARWRWSPSDYDVWAATPEERRHDLCPAAKRVILRHAGAGPASRER